MYAFEKEQIRELAKVDHLNAAEFRIVHGMLAQTDDPKGSKRKLKEGQKRTLNELYDKYGTDPALRSKLQ